MRDYGRVPPSFWSEMKALRGRPHAQVLGLYLLTCAHSNMIGIYYLPLPIASYETGLNDRQLRGAFDDLHAVEFAFYEDISETVYVPSMASMQIAETLTPCDKRRVMIAKELAKVAVPAFRDGFARRYRDAFGIDCENRGSTDGAEGRSIDGAFSCQEGLPGVRKPSVTVSVPESVESTENGDSRESLPALQRFTVKARVSRSKGKAAARDTVALALVDELRPPIDAYNEIFGTRLQYTPGNLKAVQRAYAEGYTLEQMRAVFEAVKARSTATAAWCADNNREFEYLIRPPYRKAGTEGLTSGPLDKIPNELATGRRRSGSEA